ncbi:hypothetical protein KBA41_18635, partial [Candidatus Ozemobacteraceae bacterium]|nr:hypothetical protein [Candidatus Ozemobacteraceae bacterium]
SHARLASAAGTRLDLDISGRIGNAAPGWCGGSGTLASPPDAESNVAPVEGTAEGTLVIDGSVPCAELGLLQEPLTLTIQAGRIVDILGPQAATLAAVLDRLGNPATRVLAELGVGLNPAARLCGSMLEDEGCRGTVHLGFGSNATIGGRNSVSFHLDMVLRHTDLRIDDHLVLEHGNLVIPEEAQ